MTIKLDYQTVKNLKAPGRYTDALVPGLHLWVKPNGKKYSIFRYNFNNKQHNISLGPFPSLSISEARIKAQQYRDQIDSGINPMDIKNDAKKQSEQLQAKKISFRAFAAECIKTKRAEWTNQKHGDQWEYTLEEFAYPIIGDRYLDEITMEDILEILTPIWTTKTETASRLRGRLEWVLAAATTRKLRSGINPAQWKNYLQTILPAPNKVKKVVHHKALPYRQVPELIANLREMTTMASLALEFTILNASRTGEVIDGLRTEVIGGVWTIPAPRMKARKEHRVPLCLRSLDILAIAKAMDGERTKLSEENHRKSSIILLTLRDIGDHINLFNGDYIRGRKPTGYVKYDMNDPEQLALAILATLRDQESDN